jgi:hypothetical protein
VSQPRAASRLRTLARDYADGRLDRSSYLRARTQFLDALGSNRAAASMPARSDHPAAVPTPASNAHAPRRRAWIIGTVLAVALIGAAAGGLLMWLGDTTPAPVIPAFSETRRQPAVIMPRPVHPYAPISVESDVPAEATPDSGAPDSGTQTTVPAVQARD